MRNIPAGRVEKHRLVAEPPLAIPRPANARYLWRRVLILQRKAQARIEERGRIPGAGRADDCVPRKVIHRNTAAIGPRKPRRLERPRACFESLAQFSDVFRSALIGYI